jgi:hypothetical protein
MPLDKRNNRVVYSELFILGRYSSAGCLHVLAHTKAHTEEASWGSVSIFDTT